MQGIFVQVCNNSSWIYHNFAVSGVVIGVALVRTQATFGEAQQQKLKAVYKLPGVILEKHENACIIPKFFPLFPNF
ncbi:hypothetical protein HOLleu_02758 [Holothuria leucospilota]|uniref:Uncharacterized protein n=1 Tax=Holothuria leucospilota TaxID=206669 RepID=A0A9Q1CR60_HOLLE|nr:hypothetical protein HOLleu_02758 [Holothuria leucospilota]